MTADQVPNVLVLNTPPSPPTELDDATDIIWVGGGERTLVSVNQFMTISVLFHQHIARRSLRNLEPVNTFCFLSKPGSCGKLYGVYQSTLKNMVSGASWPLLLLVVGP